MLIGHIPGDSMCLKCGELFFDFPEYTHKRTTSTKGVPPEDPRMPSSLCYLFSLKLPHCPTHDIGLELAAARTTIDML